ncbi:MAG: septal ring lytic transglycosylase RlpA family protein [Succinivibrio sp.]
MIKAKELILFSLGALAFILQGCSSAGHGSAGGGYTYGTGPNKTKPMPELEKVNINGIGGAKPVYEKQRTGGCNKDYTVLGKNYMVWNGADTYIEEGVASWYGPGFHGKKTSNGEVYNQKGFTAAHKNLPLPSYLKVTNLKNGKKVIVRVNDRGPFVGTRIIDLSEGSARAIDMIGSGTAKVRIELIKVNPGGSYANAYGTPSGSNISVSSGSYSTTSSTVSKIAKAAGLSAGATATTQKIYTKLNDYVSTDVFDRTSKNSSVSSSVKKAVSALSGYYIQLVACNSDKMADEVRANISSKTSYPVIVSKEGSINRVLVGPLSESVAKSALTTLKRKGYTDSFIKKF